MDCIFCKIAGGSIPSTKYFENERIMIIKNISPEAPFHALVIPKRHVEYSQMTEDGREIIGEMLIRAKDIGLRETPGGFRLIVNNGPDSNQEIDHLHVHILGGRNLGKLLPE